MRRLKSLLFWLVVLGSLGSAGYGAWYFNLCTKFQEFTFRDMKPVMKELKNPQTAKDLAQPVHVMTLGREPSNTAFIYQPELYREVGFIRIHSKPEANIMLINGKQVVDAAGEIVKGNQTLRLPPGHYTITLKNTEMEVYKSKEFSVANKQTLRLNFFLNDR